jgi:hypothetical protein
MDGLDCVVNRVGEALNLNSAGSPYLNVDGGDLVSGHGISSLGHSEGNVANYCLIRR